MIETCRDISCCLMIVGQNVLPQVKIQAVVESRNLNVGGVKVFLLFKRSVVPRLNDLCVFICAGMTIGSGEVEVVCS